jgi:phage terminase small subunit
MSLTIKQEKFCMVYVETGNASEAYRQAYNAENMKEASINVNASKLLTDAKIALRIKELKSGHTKRHELTIDDLVKQLEEARQVALALENPQCSAAISATMGTAKLLGLVVDKTDIKLTNVKELTNEQLAAIATSGGA